MKLSWDLGPIAHRGLHDIDRGIVENAPAAIDAAVKEGFGIEVDLQVSADSVAIVFHDFTVDRLVDATGPVRNYEALKLTAMAYRTGIDRIMSLDNLLETVAGKVPLYVEMKSDFSNDMTLVQATAPVVNVYKGPLALMSYDPWMMRAASALCPRIPCGLISGRLLAERWEPIVGSSLKRFALRHLLTAAIARPSFINYDISAITTLAPRVARLFGCPVLTWTVRTPEQRRIAAKWADAMVFESFTPTPEERADR